jgi:hypothetical protein
MTTATAAPRGGPRLRGPVWTVLRVHRSALLVWAAFILLMVGWTLWLQFSTEAAVRAEKASCGPPGCKDFEAMFAYSQGMDMVGTLIAYSSWSVAAWAGAALTGRELEQGTARLAWTQSVTPVRWLTTKLAVPAVVLIVGTTALSLLYRWAWGRNRDLMGDDWHVTEPFLNRGPAVVAYALCGLAVGALAGLALRRALPALCVAAGFMAWFHAYLTSHTSGTMANEEHPASGYWPLHLMVTGIVLTVAALATAAAFWTLRRRTR